MERTSPNVRQKPITDLCKGENNIENMNGKLQTIKEAADITEKTTGDNSVRTDDKEKTYGRK